MVNFGTDKQKPPGTEKEKLSPRGFEVLPPELQTKVSRLTAARFTVSYKYGERSEVLKRRQMQPWYGFSYLVPVVACFEFRLERRRAPGPVMHARFTRAMDPEYKETEEWHFITRTEQDEIENSIRNEVVFEPFTEIRYDDQREDEHGPYMIFSFVRSSGVEDAPKWCKFPPKVLVEVQKKLNEVFHVRLCYTPSKSPSGIWRQWNIPYE